MPEMPDSLAVLRLSALGDVCHALPAVRAIYDHAPRTKITWIIGRAEFGLIGDIPEFEFIVFDKKHGLSEFSRIKQALNGRVFDALLLMQTSLRANLLSLAVKAKRRIGYDRDRAHELHSWVINEHIEARTRQHQLDALMGFANHLGARPSPLRWEIPIPADARERAGNWLYGNKPVLVINPCSSPSKRVHRSWAPENYAAVVDAAQNELGYTVVLVGGTSALEKQAGAIICARASNPPVNLIGQTSLKELLAVLDRAEVLITSDSGPAHMANAVGTPVIALHAATNPYQTGPYLSLDWVVNKYPQAIQNEYGKSAETIKWGTRAHAPDVMNLIATDDVIEQLKRFTIRGLASRDTGAPLLPRF